jgi:alkanesulfonate monooxygenase SsuD/methylene tetrahydromethanopterin reductase-like flavin-dependent oxidoreductase (luciferase family)
MTRTSRLRLGAGGVMIRNHAPLIAAEQAVTLSLLYPGRVDLGLGRAGGTDTATDAGIRRTIVAYDSFEEDVTETVHHLDQLGAEGVQVFVLAASRETASFAGSNGLSLAVAGHVSPAGMDVVVASKYSALMISAGRLLPVGRMASGVMVGQGRQAGAGSAGIQGRPVSASRSAVILSRPCLAAVET